MTDCEPTQRGLYGWEIQEAKRVFANQIEYEKVRIHECTGWPDRVHALGLKLQGKNLEKDVHNAITVGNHCYFPTPLCKDLVQPGHGDFHKIGWLIHELTHVWQYQHMGWKYLLIALREQIKQGAAAYQFGGEDGLRQRGSIGARFTDFNLEQQGDIARSYYERIVRNENTEAWNRFVADLQGPDTTTRVA